MKSCIYLVVLQLIHCDLCRQGIWRDNLATLKVLHLQVLAIVVIICLRRTLPSGAVRLGVPAWGSGCIPHSVRCAAAHPRRGIWRDNLAYVEGYKHCRWFSLLLKSHNSGVQCN
eukprot:Gb_40366 [translate_table: standard]